MPKAIQHPKIDPSDRDGSVTTHPAFGQVRASRISGGINLYGSDFQHNNFVRIAVHSSELHRKLHTDWPFARQNLIEIDLSEAQWATFVSSLNVGQGVQCTLSRFNGEDIPGLPQPEIRADQFKDEMRAKLERLSSRIEEMGSALAGSKMPAKERSDLTGRLNSIQQELSSNLPWVAKVFGEHVEEMVERGKVEVNAYATHMFMSLGMEEAKKTITFPERSAIEDDSD